MCYVIVEKMDKIVNRNDKRKVLMVTEEPFKKDFFFNIPMTADDQKELHFRRLTDIKEIKFDILPTLLEFESEW